MGIVFMDQATIFEQMNKAAIRLLAAHPLSKLCETITLEARNLTGAQSGFLYLRSGDKLEAAYSTDERVAIKLPRKQFLKKILQQKKIVVLKQDQFKKNLPGLLMPEVQSAVFAPLLYRNAAIGLLILCAADADCFKSSHMHLVRLYLSMVSLAIVKTQLLEETERALEIRDRFISLASHELRTPLTSINGYIQLLYKKMANKDTVESRWMEELYHENIRFTNLVKDLLDINRIKQGQLAFVLDEVNIKQVIQKALARFQSSYPERTILLKDSLGGSNSIVIGDFEKLVDMISAIIENAAKFSDTQTQISIALTAIDKSIQIVLRDEGRGIPQQDLSRIFEGFYKTKYSSDKQGMGVGLLLARHVVSLHRGKMDILSKEGKGTAVRILLPAAKI